MANAVPMSLPLSATPADRALVADGFTREDRDVLAGRRKAQVPAADIVADHGVEIEATAWAGTSPWAREFPALDTAGPQVLTRGALKACAKRCAQQGHWLELLVGCVVFAHRDPTGGDPRRRLSSLLATDPALVEHRLSAALRACAAMGPTSGYDLLRSAGAVPGAGPATATRFLSLAGQALALPQPPVALDAHVVRVLTEATEQVTGDRAMAVRLWRGKKWPADRYAVWLAFAQRVGEQMNRYHYGDWNPELIELALSDPSWPLG